MPQTPSTRWCPTPEQLMILEEMYRSGVRTPNAAEIQQITAHLAYYGRIEGKNVFYWFQNHKARERQRLRRRLCARHQQQTAAVAPPPGPGPAGGSSAAGVHPAVMQLHHHHPYATCSFMPHHPHHLVCIYMYVVLTCQSNYSHHGLHMYLIINRSIDRGATWGTSSSSSRQPPFQLFRQLQELEARLR